MPVCVRLNVNGKRGGIGGIFRFREINENKPNKNMRFKILLTMAACALVYTATAQEEEAQRVRKQIGDVTYSSFADPFDGTMHHFVSLKDDRPSSGFLFFCGISDYVTTSLSMSKYMAGNLQDNVYARYRFDDEPASEYEFWSLSGDGKSVYVPDGSISNFIQRMKSSERLRIQVLDPLDSDSYGWDFSLRGFSEALALLPCETQH